MTYTLLSPCFCFFFNDTATTEIYTLSLHDALPISAPACSSPTRPTPTRWAGPTARSSAPSVPPPPWSWSPPCSTPAGRWRSEEHTSELQSQSNLVCRLLLEKKNKKTTHQTS